MAFLPPAPLSPSSCETPSFYIDLVNVAVDMAIYSTLHFWRTSGFIREGQAQKHLEKEVFESGTLS